MSMPEQPRLYIVEPRQKHAYTFIVLHGLGSNGEKFGQEFISTAKTSKGLSLTEILPHAKFIFPTAGRRRSTAFRRAVLNQWFDMASLDDPSFRKETQIQGLAESAKDIQEILRSESRSVSYENIFLGGLSQGCAMALSVFLSLDHHIGAFIGMSGWLPFQVDIEEAIREESQGDDEDNPFESRGDSHMEQKEPIIGAVNFVRELLSMTQLEHPTTEKTAFSTPVFFGHGDADPKVKYTLGDAAARTISAAGIDVTWKLYEGHGHWYMIPEEIDDILLFLHSKTGLALSS